MPRSMTAYHQCELSHEIGEWTIEIYSVNRKGLDIAISLPKEFFSLEIDVRKWLTEVLSRGQVTFKARFRCKNNSSSDTDYLLTQLALLKDLWSRRSESLGFDPKQEINLAFLLAQWEQEPLLAEPMDDAIRDLLQKAVKQCLAGFIAMREKEGRFLCCEIGNILQKIKAKIPEIQTQSTASYEKARIKLQQKVQEALQGLETLEERVLKECALLADKLDVSEEITRLFSHLAQFEQLIQDGSTVQGRTLEFLIQELFREINTIGSKSADILIAQIVIEIKANLEKIREQVQNLE